MLRLHFTAADLRRIRRATHPEPLMETVFSLQLLQQPQAYSEPFAHWSANVRAAVGRRDMPLFDLASPEDGALPELLMAPTGATSLSDGLAAVQSLPAARVVSDLASARTMRPALPQWVVDIHHRRPEATGRLSRLLDTYHRLAIAPTWQYVERAVQAAFDGTAAGPGAVLSGLHPSIGWEFPILTVPCHIPHDVDLHLEGRGLLLVPTFFLRTPTARLDNYDEQAPVEVYVPVQHDHAVLPADGTRIDPGLTRLLGRTRAAVLAALTVVCSTTELATRVDISAATASHHLNALRAGGLITTTREHGRARHSLTHLGRRLLHATRTPGRATAGLPSAAPAGARPGLQL
ncbi:winged helix-turn-helix domain-containing protein [Kitasatospora sp. NPDC085879]|uniref:winged helix-turn-helix domain-containing protein n=1 Tax=Kitasatospora sp. NPDC085879 TaxID=3154769 RepID=UPI00342237CA